MDMVSSLRVEPAEPRHLETVTAIAQAWKLDQRQAQEETTQGFLVAGWGLRQYQNFLDKADHFVIVTCHEEIAGFGIAYDHQHPIFDPWLHTQLAKRVGEYLLLEQFCVAPAWGHRGVGTALMRYMLLLRGKLPVVSEITSHPLNVASAKLHEKFGFMPFCDLIRPSGLPTTMWLLGPDEPQAPAS